MRKLEIKDLTISIVSYNSLNFLRDCLNSILENPPSLKYEIIVVDNASTDGSHELVQKNFPQVKLLHNSKNTGFAAANNKAISKTNSKYILLINSDCKVHKNSLDNLVNFMEKNKKAGTAGPKIINSDGSVQLSCRKFPSIFNAAFHTILINIVPNNPFSRKYKLADANRDTPFEVDWVSGSAMIIRRKALEDTGTIDERYFMYVEDLDLCYRMWQKNWKVYYYPCASILHHIGGSSGNGELKACFRMQRSVFYFFWKNYKKSWKVLLIPLLIIVLAFRVFITFFKQCFRCFKK